MRKIYVLFIGLILLSLAASPYLIKVRVECATQFGGCPDEVKVNIESKGQTLMAVRRKIRRELAKDPFILEYNTQFKLPNIVLVNLVVNKPKFALKKSGEENVALINIGGTILSIDTNSSLPTVMGGVSDFTIGNKVQDSDLFALNLMNGVYEMYQIGNGEIQNGSLVVELPSQIKVLFPLSGDRDLILGTLRLVISRITVGGESGKYHELDLRFKNPVLR